MALLFVLLARLRYCYELEMPAIPQPEAPSSVSASQASRLSSEVSASSGAYVGYLRRDSRAYSVEPPATPEDMGRPFAHTVDSTRRSLVPGEEGVEVLGLRLEALAEPVRGSERPQLVLQVENLEDRFVAYRIETRPSGGTRGCREKRDLRHNAIALAPRATERRTECTYRRAEALEISEVAIIELPELAYHYASSLPASRIGLEPRTARGHRPSGGGRPCRLRLSADIERALEQGGMSWRDLVDFYARHRCQTYRIPVGYKAFEPGQARGLPVVSESY